MIHIVSDTRFTSELLRVRVVFGEGTVDQIGAELDALQFGRIVLVTTGGRSSHAASIREALGARLAGAFDRAALHVPSERIREALDIVDRVRPDALLTLGGGSPVGLAKAVALERGTPIVAIPTTYAGSEMTSIWGMTDGDQKRTGRDPRVAPRLVIYDPLLTLSLPADVSASSGMNAMAHAVEALYAANVGPVAAGAADEAIRLLRVALPAIVRQPGDRDARRVAMRGAHAAGVALELASMGLHHKICHVLGGTFGLPHAPTHAALLPHVVAFNAPAVPAAISRIADALGVEDAAAGLFALNEALGIVPSLRTLGLRDEDVDRAADLITSSSYANPRTASRDDIAALLRRAL